MGQQSLKTLFKSTVPERSLVQVAPLVTPTEPSHQRASAAPPSWAALWSVSSPPPATRPSRHPATRPSRHPATRPSRHPLASAAHCTTLGSHCYRLQRLLKQRLHERGGENEPIKAGRCERTHACRPISGQRSLDIYHEVAQTYCFFSPHFTL